MTLCFKWLLTLFRFRKKSRQQLRHEKYKRGKTMGKRMTGKAKKNQRNPNKGKTKKVKKPK